ncbi:uncharacterized protein LOC115384661 [Salarias fasciatus]|uniref:uncharacterized protein LOC115384661 n=1 Tax=Salarias fasciatus TaxID=181472 RepID=UPI001176E65E|nr:uncharacterized protein LOC115384661 [Salarias fasciatus]
MPPLPPVLLLLLLLGGLPPAGGYSYQTEPLFLTFSELAALEAESRREDGGRALPAAGEELTRASLEVRCHEDSMEVLLRAPPFDPGLAAEPRRLRLGPVPAPPCTARLSGPGLLSVRAPLRRCGGTLTLSGTAVVYSNLLLLLPPPPAAGSLPGWGAAILPGWGAAIPEVPGEQQRDEAGLESSQASQASGSGQTPPLGGAGQ